MLFYDCCSTWDIQGSPSSFCKWFSEWDKWTEAKIQWGLQTHNHWSKTTTTVSIIQLKWIPKHQTKKNKNKKLQTHNHWSRTRITTVSNSNKMLTQTSNKEKKRKKLETHNHWSKPRSMVSINHTKCLPKHQTTKKREKIKNKKPAKQTEKHFVTVAGGAVGWAWSGELVREEVKPVRASWNGDALLYWNEEMKWREEWYDWRAVGDTVWKGAHHVISFDCGTG